MKKCVQCSKEMIRKPRYSKKQFENRSFCSDICRQFNSRRRKNIECSVCKKIFECENNLYERKKVCSIECKKIYLSEKYSGDGNPFYGKKHSKNAIAKIIQKTFGVPKIKNSGENSNFWKGGVSQKNRTERANIMRTNEYRIWRKAVFERDNYTCVMCSVKGGEIQADHIKPFSLFINQRFDVSNGRTLCVFCHRKTETFGMKKLSLKPIKVDWKKEYGT